MTIRAEIVEQLKAEAPSLREVAGAANWVAVEKTRRVHGGCYVFRSQTRAERNALDHLVRQRVEEQITLVVTVRNVADARGGEASDEAETLCAEIRAALLGWTPASAAAPLEYAGGALLSFADGFLHWAETYRTERYISSQ